MGQGQSGQRINRDAFGATLPTLHRLGVRCPGSALQDWLMNAVPGGGSFSANSCSMAGSTDLCWKAVHPPTAACVSEKRDFCYVKTHDFCFCLSSLAFPSCWCHEASPIPEGSLWTTSWLYQDLEAEQQRWSNREAAEAGRSRGPDPGTREQVPPFIRQGCSISFEPGGIPVALSFLALLIYLILTTACKMCSYPTQLKESWVK